MYNLETGKRNVKAFEKVDALFDRLVKKKALDYRIRTCSKCEGMNEVLMTESAVGYGNIQSNIVLVGQSLCSQCMNTGMPFTGGSGYLLDAALTVAGLTRNDVFITNAVHCHPMHNRASSNTEKNNCLEYLVQELEIVNPALVVALGADADEAVRKVKLMREQLSFKIFKVKHPAYFLHAGFSGSMNWIVKLAEKLEKYK